MKISYYLESIVFDICEMSHRTKRVCLRIDIESNLHLLAIEEPMFYRFEYALE